MGANFAFGALEQAACNLFECRPDLAQLLRDAWVDDPDHTAAGGAMHEGQLGLEAFKAHILALEVCSTALDAGCRCHWKPA